ncbi:cell cycle kinase, putative [Rhizoctonia solani AG-3 Rhs1AP]|uniref:non-specific serine/threonine protein kinase n=2 Tax=Rhizoctonia solani AG-3 TaxID=1086053 RepID=A0A074S5T7_9AGAM|nr:cell cycle kinase, putative [Rhizoctonia solani AG-3 Rhs1AP]KEP54751.1 putative cell cycle kinase [Rhizoctonia solani 123E]
MATLIHTMPSSQASPIFSEHPSNPLHVGSSDVANATYVRQARLSMSGKSKKVTRTIYAGATPKPRQRRSRNSRGLGDDESSDDIQIHQVLGDESEALVDPDEDEIDAEDVPMNDLDAAADSTELVETAENVDLDEQSEDEAEEHAAFVRQVVEPCLATSNPFWDDGEGEGDATLTFPRTADTLEDEEGGDEDAEGEDDEDYLNSKREEVVGAEVEEQDALDPGEDPSDDEENSLAMKDEMERHYISAEMRQLKERVRGLVGNYELIDRLGEGTFSSVYKAIDLNFSKYDNREWNTHLGYADYPILLASTPHSSKSRSKQYTPAFERRGRVFVAIKRIYVTSSPQRIANEIELMEAVRGCRHVSQLITAFRDEDQVVCVMPFHRSVDFRDYFQSLPMRTMQTYFRHLFRALRDIHAREIVHRDVKPANFLFDPKAGPDGTGWGVLCDFGLAQRVEYPERTQCLHTSPTKDKPHGSRTKQSTHESTVINRKINTVRKRAEAGSHNIGYKTEDHRPRVKANRAGTRGFRAPEVLFKCESQTVALDVWSAGIILLACLSGKFPLFNSNDDTEALAEIAAIVGRNKIEKAAMLHNRTFLTNIPSICKDKSRTWTQLVQDMNPKLAQPPSSWPEVEKAEHQRMVEDALELLEHCLNLDATRRITARDALRCRFLRDRKLPPDDALAPHPAGQGVCAKLHCLDATDESGQLWCVQLRSGGSRVVRADDPDARCIGEAPCRYHIGCETWAEELGEDD